MVDGKRTLQIFNDGLPTIEAARGIVRVHANVSLQPNRTLALAGNVVTLGPGGVGVVGNVTVGGLLLSSKPATNTGFSGGPRITQGGWDAPGTVHTLTWLALAEGRDNVVGTLFVHVSARSATVKRNGTATLSVVKNAGDPPDVSLTTVHRGAGLSTLAIAVSGDDVVVTTDAGCAVCWTFVSAY